MQPNIFSEEWERWQIDRYDCPFKDQVQDVRTEHEKRMANRAVEHFQYVAEVEQNEQRFDLEIKKLDIATKVLLERHKGTPLGQMMQDILTKSSLAYDAGFAKVLEGESGGGGNGDDVIDVEFE